MTNVALWICLLIMVMFGAKSAVSAEELRVLSSEGRLSSDLGGTQALRKRLLLKLRLIP